jgi:putative nucleotidyltransferase with HDIG domain
VVIEKYRCATIYLVSIILFGAAVIAWSLLDLVRHPVGTTWLVLAVLTVASAWAMPRIPGMPISFSLSDTFSISAALLFGPSAGAITAAIDGLVLSIRLASAQHSRSRVLFNVAAPAIAIWTASHLFFAFGSSRIDLEGSASALNLLARLAMFAAVDFCLSSGMVAAAVGLDRRLPILSIWRRHFADLWINYFGGVYAAMLLLLFARLRTTDLLILVTPLPVILYATFRRALGRAQDQVSHLGKANLVYIAAIEALAHAVDSKDRVTHDHIRRVQDESIRLARALGVTDESEIQAINAAALLHDVGKLAIPEQILNKPGGLTPTEYEIMKRHASIGADILSAIDFPYAVVPIVRHHHENWDGSGYPDGLAGNRIPIGSRILAVVDCFDALTSDRPYRQRMAVCDALRIVAERRGTMYDPGVVDAFFELRDARSSMA